MKSQYQDHFDPGRKAGDEPDEPQRQAWRQFVAFLRNKGARVTRARRIVLERAAARRDHFRADDLASDLAHGTDRVSRGTVYRTLALMVEAGFARTIRDADVHAHYEYVRDHDRHDHMICERCGRFVEFQEPTIADRVASACRRHGFEQRTHRVEVFGLCRQCTATEATGDNGCQSA